MNVVDSDVLIDFLRGTDPGASWLENALARGSPVATTSVSRFELRAGARGKRQIAAVDTLLAAIPALPLDADAADRAAAIRQALEAEGDGIGMADSLIAGTVMRHGGAPRHPQPPPRRPRRGTRCRRARMSHHVP